MMQMKMSSICRCTWLFLAALSLSGNVRPSVAQSSDDAVATTQGNAGLVDSTTSVPAIIPSLREKVPVEQTSSDDTTAAVISISRPHGPRQISSSTRQVRTLRAPHHDEPMARFPIRTRPTKSRTAAQTLPTASPTIITTVDLYANHVAPENPDPWYFNYDTSSPYGPGDKLALTRIKSVDMSGNATSRSFQPSSSLQVNVQKDYWGQVTSPPLGQNYWTEFTNTGFGPYQHVLDLHHPDQNLCSIGLLQSPIDVREMGGGGGEDANCREEHEIRSLPGDFSLHSGNVEKRIEHNKLRLVYQRRPCANLTLRECQEPDPPNADFPNGWGGFADVLHVDFKVPSEHTIEGERFDAEMQIVHIHPGRRRLAVQAVLIRAQQGGYNFYFQQALDAFQETFDKNAAICAQRQRISHQQRSLTSSASSPFVDFLSWAKESLGFRQDDGSRWKKQFADDAWDPHHKMLVPSIYFYRYEGSLTEPPCAEFVSWWITDQTMTIATEQLEQLQRILFTNVDPKSCVRTSTHFGHSVARPIRQGNNRQVYKCTPHHFGPDS